MLHQDIEQMSVLKGLESWRQRLNSQQSAPVQCSFHRWTNQWKCK